MVARRLLLFMSTTAAVAPISYKLQNINLAERWLGLVRAGSVSATTEHGEAYGVAEVAGDLRFFVRGATERHKKSTPRSRRAANASAWRRTGPSWRSCN